MDARLSHALVALAAVTLTVVGYTIADGVASTVRGIAGDGEPRAAKVEKAERPERSDKGERGDEERGKGDHVGKGDEAKAERPAGAEPPGGGGKLAERAEEMGVDARDLREQLAAEAGMTLEQYKKRRQGRSDWRSQQPAEELAARRDARHERKAVGELTPEDLAELEAQRQLRRDVAELDPSLKDAAGVLKALRQVGEGYEPADAPLEDEEPVE